MPHTLGIVALLILDRTVVGVSGRSLFYHSLNTSPGDANPSIYLELGNLAIFYRN
jgi:hypothetical protein